MTFILRLLLLFVIAVPSYAQPVNYTLSDSLRFSNEITGGTARVLIIDNQIIDTISAVFGVKALDESTIVYQKVEIYGGWSEADSAYEGDYSDYRIFKYGEHLLLRNLLPQFDDWFSSPSIIQGWIYYWGLEPVKKSDSTSIYAMRYDYKNRKVESIFLSTEDLATDNPGSFYPPIVDKKGYQFQSEPWKWIVNSSFTEMSIIK